MAIHVTCSLLSLNNYGANVPYRPVFQLNGQPQPLFAPDLLGLAFAANCGLADTGSLLACRCASTLGIDAVRSIGSTLLGPELGPPRHRRLAMVPGHDD